MAHHAYTSSRHNTHHRTCTQASPRAPRASQCTAKHDSYLNFWSRVPCRRRFCLCNGASLICLFSLIETFVFFVLFPFLYQRLIFFWLSFRFLSLVWFLYDLTLGYLLLFPLHQETTSRPPMARLSNSSLTPRRRPEESRSAGTTTLCAHKFPDAIQAS